MDEIAVGSVDFDKFEASFEAAAVRAGKSRSARKPLRTLPRLTRAREQSSRWTSWEVLISSEKTAMGSRSSRAMCSAIFIASAVLPMEGRAAMMIISAG